MAYDDDGSLGFRRPDDLTSIIDRLLGGPENLPVSRVIQLANALAKITQGRSASEIRMQEVAAALREQGLGSVPVDVVAQLANVVAPVAHQPDVLSHVTLRNVQDILSQGR